jgi:transcriptional regulator with XRE-family HTH domain
VLTYRKNEPIYDLIARRLRQVRETCQLTQSDVAAAMTQMGFVWTRVTVAEVEGEQHRRVSLAEWLGLALVFGIPATQFLMPENGTVAFTDQLDGVDAKHLSLILNVGTTQTGDEIEDLLVQSHDLASQVQYEELEVLRHEVAKSELEARKAGVDKLITELSTKKVNKKPAKGGTVDAREARPTPTGKKARRR